MRIRHAKTWARSAAPHPISRSDWSPMGPMCRTVRSVKSGCAVPDPRWGEAGLALIVPSAGTSFDPEALARRCAAHLAKYKCPARYVAVDAIPRSAAGKILKPALRARLNAGEFT